MGPQLVSLALKLEAARNRAEVQTSLRQLLADLAGQTREVIADVRRLVYALRPPALDELGLIAALAQIGEAPGQNLVFEFDRPDHLPPLPAAVEVAAYRIAQEALTNVVRHADAKWCRLRLGLSSDGMLLEVTDDGAGLDDSRRPGIGLRSMRERAEELGGTFELGSPAGGGCRVMAFLPCRADG
jgi:signal transduction histidine kinase